MDDTITKYPSIELDSGVESKFGLGLKEFGVGRFKILVPLGKFHNAQNSFHGIISNDVSYSTYRSAVSTCSNW